MAPGTVCVPVPGSETDEAAERIMKDCRKHANTGIWFPFINDCHNKTDRCLRRQGFDVPDNPRFGIWDPDTTASARSMQ